MERLAEFLKTSYTAFHAVQNAETFLLSQGFVRLNEGEDWLAEEGGKYFVTRGGSSLIAFTVGALDSGLSFKIAASHADSPALKLKDNAVIKTEAYEKLNAECYGGGIWYSFFDRPLKIAGRIVTEESGTIRATTVTSDYFVTIPSVAIHQSRGVNEGFAVNAQTDLSPLYSFAEQGDDFVSSFSPLPVIAYDLFLVNAQEPYFFGRNNEFFASPRIDNLTSVFASLNALCGVCAPEGVCVAAIFNNEETGSRSLEGAAGDFLERTLRRLTYALKFDDEEYYKALHSSFLLSVDNAHALHPNHPEKCDPTNRPAAGGGVTVKYHADKAYVTDALSAAAIITVFKNAGVPYQKFYNRSDMRSGSTLGAISLSKVCVKSADIGIAQFAMHSACESFAVRDYSAMLRGLKAFFATSFYISDDGIQIR
ncbi:MAG: M18 family aminopeptidase [Candidatus Borkfalkiaceae bacterium]|nr:M18 family aminopeptidase [Clostridia bacterium]MDY6223248.1 M18 family aminopeptidase [Christensenellaceae bacterium]